MIEKSLSAIWNALAPGLANHLWQSTLVAAAAGLLTLALRKHHARARYWLWLAASLKFLVPFSLLVGIGHYLARSRPAATAQPTLYSAFEEFTQPFALPSTPAFHAVAPSISSSGWVHFLPAIVAAWLCGFLVVLLVWTIRWRRISAAMKSAEPLSEGRELGALRRVERLGGIRKPIALLLSRTSIEPGIFGIARPVLIGPKASPIVWKTRTSRPFSRTKSGTCAAATISTPRSTCWSRPSFGFTRWSGGWVRACSTSANVPATKRSWNSAATATSTPKAF